MTVKSKHDLFKAEMNILRLLLFAFKLRAQRLPSFFISILSQINLKMKTSLHSFLLRQLCILVILRGLNTPDCPILSDPGAGHDFFFFCRHRNKCQSILLNLFSPWLCLDVSFWVYHIKPNSHWKGHPCGEGAQQEKQPVLHWWSLWRWDLWVGCHTCWELRGEQDGLILCFLALPWALLLPPIAASLVAFSLWSVLSQHWHQCGESCFSASDRRTSSFSPFCSTRFVFDQASLSSESISVGVLQGSLWSAGYLPQLLTFTANLGFQ